jgi:hypothetical protein
LVASALAVGSPAAGGAAEAPETLVVLGRQMPEKEKEAHGPAALTELADQLRREGFTLHQEGRVVFAFSPGVLPVQRMANNLLKARTIARLAGPDRTFSLRDEPDLRRLLSAKMESAVGVRIAEATLLGVESTLDFDLTANGRTITFRREHMPLSVEAAQALRRAPARRADLSMDGRRKLGLEHQGTAGPPRELLRTVETSVFGRGSDRELTRRILLAKGIEVLGARFVDYRASYELAYAELRRQLEQNGDALSRILGATFEELPGELQRTFRDESPFPGLGRLRFDYRAHGFRSYGEADAFLLAARVSRADLHIRIRVSTGTDATGQGVGIAIRIPSP